MFTVDALYMFQLIVPVMFGKTEIYKVKVVTVLTGADTKIVRFYIVVDDVPIVDVVDCVDHLIG